MFLSSARVPSSVAPLRITDTLASQRKRALLQVAVVDPEVDQHVAQRLEVLGRLVGGAQVGLADDLEQRHAGAVQVDQRAAAGRVVDVLAGVLLHVDAA